MTENKVLELIKKVLEEENEEYGTNINITLESELGDEGWDSLGHLSILAALDKEFDGKIAAISEMATADSVKSITEILQKHRLI